MCTVWMIICEKTQVQPFMKCGFFFSSFFLTMRRIRRGKSHIPFAQVFGLLFFSKKRRQNLGHLWTMPPPLLALFSSPFAEILDRLSASLFLFVCPHMLISLPHHSLTQHTHSQTLVTSQSPHIISLLLLPTVYSFIKAICTLTDLSSPQNTYTNTTDNSTPFDQCISSSEVEQDTLLSN